MYTTHSYTLNTYTHTHVHIHIHTHPYTRTHTHIHTLTHSEDFAVDCGYGVDIELPGQDKDVRARKVHVIAGADGGMELHGDEGERRFKQVRDS